MTMKAFKYRIFPTAKQKDEIWLNINCSRYVFNFSLATQKRKDEMWYIVEEMYQSGQLPQNNWKGSFFNKINSEKAVTKLKKNHPFLKEVDSTALQNAVGHIDQESCQFIGK